MNLVSSVCQLLFVFRSNSSVGGTKRVPFIDSWVRLVLFGPAQDALGASGRSEEVFAVDVAVWLSLMGRRFSGTRTSRLGLAATSRDGAESGGTMPACFAA